jgi:hypothetical protein
MPSDNVAKLAPDHVYFMADINWTRAAAFPPGPCFISRQRVTASPQKLTSLRATAGPGGGSGAWARAGDAPGLKSALETQAGLVCIAPAPPGCRPAEVAPQPTAVRRQGSPRNEEPSPAKGRWLTFQTVVPALGFPATQARLRNRRNVSRARRHSPDPPRVRRRGLRDRH